MYVYRYTLITTYIDYIYSRDTYRSYTTLCYMHTNTYIYIYNIYTVCILCIYTVQGTVYIVHCTIYSMQYVYYNVQCIL